MVEDGFLDRRWIFRRRRKTGKYRSRENRKVELLTQCGAIYSYFSWHFRSCPQNSNFALIAC